MSIRSRLITGAVLAVLAFGAGWMINGWRWDARLARAEAQHADVLEKQAQAVVASVQAARSLEQRRTADMEKQRDLAIEQTEALAADVAAGRAASERLRIQLEKLRVSTGGSDTSATQRSQGEQGIDAIGVLIELYTGLDNSGREVAEYADRIRVAGLACERGWDAMRK